ncbi:MAG: L-rhamnose mutarotase [Phycisphaerales bacterium]|nr:L-rhamnose mutarotase [Phycisphaerales bacterium]
MASTSMQRVCFLLKVKADRLEAYRRAHETVWPEMLEALSRHGWTNYSLFLRPDGLLIGYLETPDWEAALAGMQDEEINAKWQAQMKDYFEALGAANADESMQPLEEVFHLA